MVTANKAAIFTPEVQSLMTLVEESTRSTKEAVRYFVQPGEGILDRAKSRRHQIVFGRRGSGKSSLLSKIYADQLVARKPSALVDLEAFKGHSYPDVLVSVLIKTFLSLLVGLIQLPSLRLLKLVFGKPLRREGLMLQN